jgi:hypothetical protein
MVLLVPHNQASVLHIQTSEVQFLFGLRTYKLFLLFRITDMMSIIETKQLIKKHFNKTENRYSPSRNSELINLLHSAPVISPPLIIAIIVI